MSTSGSKSNEHVAHFLVDIHIVYSLQVFLLENPKHFCHRFQCFDFRSLREKESFQTDLYDMSLPFLDQLRGLTFMMTGLRFEA